MKVVGFTFIRNAIKYDYPIVEAILSILPLCDQVVVAVGASEDETLSLIQNIPSGKIRIIETVWDDHLREGGRVLAEETNKAYDAIDPDADWCFYIQGDEVVHENDHPNIKNAMKTYLNTPEVEGLLFKYRHFYGSYDYIGDSRRWYRREVRIVRKNAAIRSYLDAQGFRKDNKKLRVKLIDAYVHHYGWVKHPAKQQEKQMNFNKLWHSDDWMETNIPDVDAFDYSNIDFLKRYTGTHPKVMQDRIDKVNWSFSFDPTRYKPPLKYRFLHWVESRTGWRLGEYRNYSLLSS